MTGESARIDALIVNVSSPDPVAGQQRIETLGGRRLDGYADGEGPPLRARTRMRCRLRREGPVRRWPWARAVAVVPPQQATTYQTGVQLTVRDSYALEVNRSLWFLS